MGNDTNKEYNAKSNKSQCKSPFLGNWKAYKERELNLLKSAPEPAIHLGWIVDGGINILYDEGGKGKSILCFSSLIELCKKYPDSQGFYIDFDNPASIPKSRGFIEYLEKLDNMHYINVMHLNDLNEFAKSNNNIKITDNKLINIINVINKTTDNEKIFIVIDSLQNFLDITDSNKVDPAFDLLKRLSDRFTYIIIHHKNKMSQFKGLTTIRDKADSFYNIKNVETSSSGLIIKQSIIADKRRFLTEEEITFIYDDLVFQSVVFSTSLTKDEEVILKTAISILEKSKEKINQTKLVEAVKNKLKNTAGIKKIERIIKTFKEKHLFKEEIGDKNAKYYSVNKLSPYYEILYPLKLPEDKQELKRLIFRLNQSGIDIKNIKVNNITYTNLDSILNALPVLEDAEVKELINVLSEYLSSPSSVSLYDDEDEKDEFDEDDEYVDF